MQFITLHQALHGYKDGHRALATSTELAAQDAKTLLVLSDVSGSGSRLEASGYITGYPLPNAGYYALARTWPAPEMSRPGCVWTHTLFIDFADLATIGDPIHLLEYFKRPEAPTFVTYNKTITFDEGSQLPPISDKIVSISKTLMAALYEFPSKPIISFESNSGPSEEAVLAIWGQQWPRLRRSFRFCTLASSDRSTKEAVFDLQLLPPSMPSVKSQFTNAVEARASQPDPDWLSFAVDELINMKPDGLRQFLFQAGSDLQNGRSSFANLCRIFGLLEVASDDQNNVETALQLIPDPSDATNARALKGMVTRRLFAHRGTLSKKVLSYIVEHLEFLDLGSATEEYTSFGRKLLRSQPKLFLKMRESGEQGYQIFRETLTSATVKDILAVVKKTPPILPHVLTFRPTLLCEPDIWSGLHAEDTDVLDCLGQLENPRDALCAAIVSERLDLSEALLQHAEPIEIISVLHHVYVNGAAGTQSLSDWIGVVGSPEVIGKFLSSQKVIDYHFLLVVSQSYAADDIPSRAKRDPWLSAIEAREGELDRDDEIHFHAYILTRALGDVSKNAAELALFGFDLTDHATATGRLSYHSWHQLERRLPRPPLWQDWDRCYRLRKGLAEKSLNEDWPLDIFINLAKDDKVFATLVVFANGNYRGRKYLNAIKDQLKGSKNPLAPKRRAIINKLRP